MMKTLQGHFQICPSLWPLSCLLRLSWTNISAVTLSPADPDSPNHSLSLMVFNLIFPLSNFTPQTVSRSTWVKITMLSTWLTFSSDISTLQCIEWVFSIKTKLRLNTFLVKPWRINIFHLYLLDSLGPQIRAHIFHTRRMDFFSWLFFQLSHWGTMAAGTRNRISG